MFQAKAIFTSICPDKEFLEAVPNPEDIIWDDLSNNPHAKQEPVGDEQSLAGSKERTEESRTTNDVANAVDDGGSGASTVQSGQTTILEHNASVSGVHSAVTDGRLDGVGSSEENTEQNSSLRDDEAGTEAQETTS